MKRHKRMLAVLLATVVAFTLGAVPAGAAGTFSFARIYIEYNSSANDLGYHVTLDGEDWRELEIVNPKGTVIFEVEGRGPYSELGMTELFFEGAEPNLDDFPLEDLLALFPQGRYRFIGETVDGRRLASTARLSHAVPAGPDVSSEVNGNSVTISWNLVTSAPPGFPVQAVNVVAYQVLVGTFQVTLPGSATSVVVPEAYISSLPSGTHPFEVLAIEESGNQTITEGTFTK